MFKAKSLIVVALAAAAAAIAAPTSYVNQKWGFTATYPEGWIVGELATGPIVVTALAPLPEAGVVCNTTAESIAGTAKMTQSEINAQNAEALSPQFWLTNVYNSFQKIAIEKTAQRLHPSGISLQEAVAAFDITEEGQTIRLKAHTGILITPGTTYSTTCLTIVSKFEQYRETFAYIIDSFRKGKGDLTADANAAAPSVVNILNLNIEQLAVGAGQGVKYVKSKSK